MRAYRMKIDTILWDVDGTLLNFSMAEDISVRECLSRYHVEVSDAQMKIYKKIHQEFWKMLERGEITGNKPGLERKPLTGNVRIDYEIRELSQVQECL